MDIPGLPTDNLYKFVALSNLFAACFFWWTFIRKYEEQYSKWLKINRLQRQKIAKVLSERRIQSAVLQATRAAGVQHSELSDTISRELEEDHKFLTDEQRDELAMVSNHRKSDLWSTLLMMVGMLGISAFGFFYWYDKVQRFQDEVTIDAAREQKAKADLAEVELARAQRAARRHRR